MNRVGYNVVLKYCEVIDEFIKVRVFSEEDAHLLLRVESIPNKRAYQQLIINSCIINYCDNILPRLRDKPEAGQPEIVEEFLDHLCVEVNPQLEIHNVVLPIADGGATGEDPIHLLGRPETEAAAAAGKSIRFDKLGDLRTRLRRQVIGQSEAIDAVTHAIRKAAVGLKDPNRPIGTFLFVGQTGVGKTELAKAVARCVFDDPSHMIRVDCSEYSQPHEYAKLLGAPPGYVGHNEGGYLTEQVKALGSCVVLFDEVEKAHEKLHNLLLQMFDEGFVTDSHGNRVNFHDSIIILTSNVGTRELGELNERIGFEADEDRPLLKREIEEETRRALKRHFRPEFLNRVDDLLVFNSLTYKDCVRIVGRMLTELGRLVRRAGVKTAFHRRVKEFIAREGYHQELGARELRRTVAARVETALTGLILEGRAATGDTVRVDVQHAELSFAVDGEATED